MRGESGTAGTYRSPPRSAQLSGSGALRASTLVPATLLATVIAAALLGGAVAFLDIGCRCLRRLQHSHSFPLD